MRIAFMKSLVSNLWKILSGSCEKIILTYIKKRSADLFSHDCSPVSQYFGNAIHYFVGIITHTDDGICSAFSRMLHHKMEGFFTGFLTKLNINSYLAAQ